MLSKDLEPKQKFCWITYIKIKNPKYPPFKNLPSLCLMDEDGHESSLHTPKTMCLTCSTTSCWSSSRSTRTPRSYRYTVYRLLWMGIFYSWFNKTYIFLGICHGDPRYGRLPWAHLDWSVREMNSRTVHTPPLYSISLWNHKDSILEGNETTNNHIEGMSCP